MPGLWRRSMEAAAQWRLLLLWLAGLALPAAAMLVPVGSAFNAVLSHSPRAPLLVASLDLDAAADLGRYFTSPEGAAARGGGAAMIILALLSSPLLAAAMVAAARAPERLAFRELLRGAGEHYGRMLRMLLVAAIPLGIAGAITAGAMGGAKRAGLKALTEASAGTSVKAAVAVAAIVFFLAHLTLDLARGVMAAEPDRRSALLAWAHGVRVFFRRPLAALVFAALATLSAFLPAAVLLFVRLKLPQTNASGVASAFVVAQLALAALGWGRAARIIGFAELVRTDSAARARPAQPPALAAETTLPAALAKTD